MNQRSDAWKKIFISLAGAEEARPLVSTLMNNEHKRGD